MPSNIPAGFEPDPGQQLPTGFVPDAPAPAVQVRGGIAGPGSTDPDAPSPPIKARYIGPLERAVQGAPMGANGEQRNYATEAEDAASATRRERENPIANDPGAQMIIGGILGAGAGAAVSPMLGGALPAAVARTAATGVEAGVANKAQGGDFSSGALLGVVPGAARLAAKTAQAVAEPAVAALTKKVGERMSKEIITDIGEGNGLRQAATPTARRQLERDKADVVSLVMKEPQVAAAIRKHPAEGLPIVQEHAHAVGKQLKPIYDNEVDKALGGGVRVGDYVEHLEARADALEATGQGYDASIGKKLRERANLIKSASDWGGSETIRLAPDAQQELTHWTRIRDNYTAKGNAEGAATATAEIGRLRATGEKVKGFDPDRVIPTWKLRQNVTDLQRTAFDSEGGLNGTERYKRSSAVSGEAKDFLDAKLDEAEAKMGNKGAVAKLRGLNDDYSALMNIEKSLAQRLERDGKGSLLTKLMHTASAAGAVHGLMRGNLAEAAGAAALPVMAHLAGRDASHLANLGLAKLLRAVQARASTESIGTLAKQAIASGADPTMVQRITTQMANRARQERKSAVP